MTKLGIILDEQRLWVDPFFVGTAAPEICSTRDSRLTKLSLIDTKALKTGVVIVPTSSNTHTECEAGLSHHVGCARPSLCSGYPPTLKEARR